MNTPPDPTVDVETFLPHRPPFLFVDRVLTWEPAESIRAEKELAEEADVFKGHFPGRPIMPGVLITEALAQTAGLLLGLTWSRTADRSAEKSRSVGSLFLAADRMKFLSPAYPGERLLLDARLTKAFGGLFQFQVAAAVGPRAVAQGMVTLALENG